MKKIKIPDQVLDKVLGQVMIEPSITIHKKGGHIYALGSDWNLEIKNELIFKRRKVLRLIRKYKKTLKENAKNNSFFDYQLKYSRAL